MTDKSTPTMSEVQDNETLPTAFRVLAFYKFVSPKLARESLKPLQSELETTCRAYHTRGTLLLAEEGINGTICYPFPEQSTSDPLLDFLRSKFEGLRIRTSASDHYVFARLKIKIKHEIVTMHQDEISPTECVGMYVKPDRWNELLQDPDCLVIDTRNDYEVQVGTFRNAVNPQTHSFTEFPDWLRQQLNENKQEDTKIPNKIAMFCTGGIRCEKATGACLQLVPKDVPVYHLEGGILAYLDTIPPEKSLFDGDCYVFDQRIAVTHGLIPSTKWKDSCKACRHPLSTEAMQRDEFIEGLSCQYCAGHLTDKQRERFEARQLQIELARQRGEVHIHDPKEMVLIK